MNVVTEISFTGEMEVFWKTWDRGLGVKIIYIKRKRIWEEYWDRRGNSRW